MGERFLQSALFRYHRFMKLKTEHPDDLLIPTIDIEFVWQSHMIRPDMYLTDIKSVFGVSMIDHRLRATDHEMYFLDEALRRTAVLWKKEFDEEYCDLSAVQGIKPPYFQASALDAEIVTDIDRLLCYTWMGEMPFSIVPPTWMNPFGFVDVVWL